MCHKSKVYYFVMSHYNTWPLQFQTTEVSLFLWSCRRQTCFQFFQWPVSVPKKREIHKGPKIIFYIDHHCKRDVCKTADKTPQSANKVNYDSFYSECLIHEGFIFLKLSLSWEKRVLKSVCHYNLKRMGWWGTCGQRQRGKHYRTYSVGRIMLK